MTITKASLTRFALVLLITGAIIIFGGLRAGSHAAAVQAANGNSCGAFGTYGYTGFGTTFPGNALGFPAGTVSTNGTITVEKNGHFTIHEVEVVDGHVLNPSATFEGTLTAGPDCTFTATLPPLPGPAFVGVVVDNGKQVRALITIPGVQVNFVSTAQVAP